MLLKMIKMENGKLLVKKKSKSNRKEEQAKTDKLYDDYLNRF